jgi:hypothetical protein
VRPRTGPCMTVRERRARPNGIAAQARGDSDRSVSRPRRSPLPPRDLL